MAAAALIGRISVAKDIDSHLVELGILRMTSGHIEFRHYSLHEYFIARALAHQLSKYSAFLLHRLNLIYMYNINRFLVPILAKQNEVRWPNKNPSSRCLNVDGSWKLLTAADGKRVLAHSVTCNQWLSFLKGTNWRAEGFGLWTTKTAPDGTQPFEGKDILLEKSLELDSMAWAEPNLDEAECSITSISWYDAFQFCRWVGGRLPTSEEVMRFRYDGKTEATHEWTSTWLDERKSLMAVGKLAAPDAKCELQGVNPDMRSELIGFRVVWDP